MGTDQELVTQKKRTISQQRNSFATPQTARENTMPHVYPHLIVVTR